MNLAPPCSELEEDYKRDTSYREDLISSTESDIWVENWASESDARDAGQDAPLQIWEQVGAALSASHPGFPQRRLASGPEHSPHSTSVSWLDWNKDI